MRKENGNCPKCFTTFQSENKTCRARLSADGKSYVVVADEEQSCEKGKSERLTFVWENINIVVDSKVEVNVLNHLFKKNNIVDVTKYHFGQDVQKTFDIGQGANNRYRPDGFSEELRNVVEIRSAYTNNLKLLLTESCILKNALKNRME